MKISGKGLVELAGHEGIVVAPYRDSVGTWTFGVGHTASAGPPDPQEMSGAMPKDVDAAVRRAIRLFREDIEKYEARVNDAIKVPLKQHQFDALVSFDYNTGGIYRAKLTQEINSGDKSGDGFMGWLQPPEIRGRRTAEMVLFQTGGYGANGGKIPVYKTDGRGNLDGVLKTVDGTELLAQLDRADPANTVGWGNIFASIFSAIRYMLKGGKS